MQIQADYSRLNVSRATNLESTALGAAMLASLGAQVWPNLHALSELQHTDKEFRPSMDNQSRTQARNVWQRAIERAGGWANELTSD